MHKPFRRNGGDEIMLDKIYLEITNVCNLDCSFCHKTSRAKKLMTEEEFNTILHKIEGRARYLFFHLMGEPPYILCSPTSSRRRVARDFCLPSPPMALSFSKKVTPCSLRFPTRSAFPCTPQRQMPHFLPTVIWKTA